MEIKKGDLIMSNRYRTVKYIATSDRYIKRFAGTGEFLDDWYFEPCVDILDPETGYTGWMRLADVTKA